MANHAFRAAGLNSRLLTGLGLAVLLSAVWLTGGLALVLLVAVVSVLAQWECCSLFLPGPTHRYSKILAVLLGLIYLAVCWLAPHTQGSVALIAAVLVLTCRHLFRWRQEKAPETLRRDAVLLASLLYVPLLLAPALHFTPMEQLLVVMVPAFSDIGAYFVGVRYGKHKIWPAVSPGKSVEGAAAGLLAAVLSCCVLGVVGGSAHPAIFVPLGLLLGFAAQMGDFFESALKRSAGVKDSGSILPGHGGMLDRIDSILFATAAYAVLSAFFPFFA